MKIKFWIILLASIVMTGSVYATQCPLKYLQVPFTDEQINSSDYDGLRVDYDMTTKNSANKIVCTITHSYKAWLNVLNAGVLHDADTTFGGTHIDVLRNQGESYSISETMDVYRVDEKGYFVLHNEQRLGDFSATASCSYADDSR